MVDQSRRVVDSRINLGTNLVDFILSVEVSANDIICLNKLVELSLKVLVLLGKQERVLLKSLQLRFEVKVAVHQGLI